MKRIHSSRRGYTYVEILVVVTIIGILVALMLPAVQAAREAARRTNCSQKLEQLIIAVHHYEAHHGVYPPGTINDAGPIQSVPSGYHHGWIVQLLPHLEQKNAYAHTDQFRSVYDAANAPVRRLALPVLHCPSQGYLGRGYSDYAGVHHDVEAPINTDNNGTFFLNSRIRYFDVKDGTSQTLFMGEKLTHAGDLGWMSGTRATLRNTGVPLNNRRRSLRPPSGLPPGMPASDAMSSSAGGDNSAYQVESTPNDEELIDAIYGRPTRFIQPVEETMVFADHGMSSGVAPEPEVETSGESKPLDVSLAVGGFGSHHPGGGMFARGDGSVHFVSETIDDQVYIQLGHRADNKLLHYDQ